MISEFPEGDDTFHGDSTHLTHCSITTVDTCFIYFLSLSHPFSDNLQPSSGCKSIIQNNIRHVITKCYNKTLELHTMWFVLCYLKT